MMSAPVAAVRIFAAVVPFRVVPAAITTGLLLLSLPAPTGSAIMMTLTHYATGTSPIIFGRGYVTMGTWWRVGFIMCVVELPVFATLGTLWWKMLGYW